MFPSKRDTNYWLVSSVIQATDSGHFGSIVECESYDLF
jgi:hypothetical protein